jgi:hypothetical protein
VMPQWLRKRLDSSQCSEVVETPQPNLVAGMKWFLGRRELLEQVSARPGPRHFGEAVQEASEGQAERLVVQGLKRLGWTEEVLRAKRRGDAPARPRNQSVGDDVRRL